MDYDFHHLFLDHHYVNNLAQTVTVYNSTNHVYFKDTTWFSIGLSVIIFIRLSRNSQPLVVLNLKILKRH